MKNKVAIISFIVLLLGSCSGTAGDDTKNVARSMHKSVKRGVAFSFGYVEDLPLLSSAISWNYNWGPDQESLQALWMDDEKIEFCPMAWGRNFNENRIRTFVNAHPSVKYLLAFNEPNLTDQARMTPSEAAALWPNVKQLADELGLKIVSPAMNYGTLSGYSDPIKWLDEFFSLVPLSDIDAISVHCYMANPEALKNYVKMFEKYGKPIWMTEFCAWEDYAIHSQEDQMKYMCEVVNFMETSNLVERYAWFIPRAKEGYPYMQLITQAVPGELTDAGKLYCGLSSFDKTVWLNVSNEMLLYAKDYVAINDDAVQVRPSTDGDGLMLNVISEGQQVEYQIYNSESTKQISLRYASLTDAMIVLSLDGKNIGVFTLPAGGNSMQSWTTTMLPVSVKAGKHTLQVQMLTGVINLYWMQFTK